MAPLETPWTQALGNNVHNCHRTSLVASNDKSSNNSNHSSRRSSIASNNSSDTNNSECERWGCVKTWMFGHLLASSFAKVSLDGSRTSSRAGSDACSNDNNNNNKPTGTNDWDAYYAPPKLCVSASSSSTTLCADLDDAVEHFDVTHDSDSNSESDASTSESSTNVFDVVRLIGSGSYGTVLLCRVRRTNALVAIKVVDKRKLSPQHRPRDAMRLVTERRVLSAIGAHPFITTLYSSFETPTSLHFAMEYCAGGDLYYLLEKCRQHRLSEAHVSFYAASIALALSHVHAQGVVYRDLKPENVLLDADGFVRLADFGFAKQIDELTRCTTFCGSADYVAPEVVRGDHYDGAAADVWSFGCVVFELLTGFPPFYAPSDRRLLFHNIQHASLAFPPYLSRAVCDLLTQLLHKDPLKRMRMADVFAHAFFVDVDWYALATKQMTPPRKPMLADPLDTSNFEAQFTTQRVGGPIVCVNGRDARSEHKQQNECEFDGFDWCSPDAVMATP